MAGKATKPTLKEWLAQYGRDEPVHYKEIAEALERDPASVSASLSIEWKQAQEDNRPAYFVRTGPGLYQYNYLCEETVDEDKISDILAMAVDFERATRRELRHEIAKLSIEEFERIARIVLLSIRALAEEAEEVNRYSGNIVLLTSWKDDGSMSPVVVFIKKCDYDEKIGFDFIREIRGTLPKFKANQGVLITNGVVTEEGKLEALGYTSKELKAQVQPVNIIDNDILLNVLIESRQGVRVKNVEIILLNTDFFKREIFDSRK
ncbi:MAG: restriction endonuclease [Promethearchaeota archaeon]